MAAPLIIGTNGFVAAIDPPSGQELWRTRLQGPFSATASSDVAVLVRDGMVFAGSCGHLFGLSVEDGRILWHNELSGLGYNDVAMAVENASIQYLEKVVHRNSST